LVEFEGNVTVIATTREKIGFFAFTDIAFDITLGILRVGGLIAKLTKNPNFF